LVNNDLLKQKKKNNLLQTLFITSMLIIPVIHWCVFWFGVNINSILMAFQLPTGEWSLDSLRDIFLQIFSKGTDMSIAVRNTLIYFIKDILMLPFQLLIAYFFFKKIAGYKFFRIIFYLPAIVSGVAVANMFSNFIAPSGPIGVLLKNLGVNPIPRFLANSSYATGTILFFTIWQGWGGNMLLLGGALARIPLDVLESAKLDGVNPIQELVFMIIPLVWSTMSTLLILTMTALFTASGPILLFTKGNYDTMTIGYWIFDAVAYQGVGAYNSVAAAGLIFTCVGAPIILFVKWLIEKVPTVEY